MMDKQKLISLANSLAGISYREWRKLSRMVEITFERQIKEFEANNLKLPEEIDFEEFKY